jgi:hypothetical protein
MKISKFFFLFFALFCTANLHAQSPQSINYQAVVRDAGGVVVVNKAVSFRLSILTGSSTGNIQYVETHSAVTNAFGLVTLNIGLGTPTLGTMSSVTWATGSKFLRVEVDVNGGTNFTVLGTTQFLSVPYALYAATSGNSAASGWLPTGNTTTTGNYIGTNNADDLRFYTEGSQKMVLKTNGYFGLGTNTPAFKMSIDNEANQTAGVDDGRTLLQLHNKSLATFATTNLRIKTGNTQYVTMLAHYGPTYTQYPNFADYGLMLSTGPGLMLQAPSGNIRFMTGLQPNNAGIYDRMVITNAGNVGIGTTTPSARLAIEGIGEGTGTFDDRTFFTINNQSTSPSSQASLKITSGNSTNNTSLSHVSPTYTVYPNYANFGQLSSSGNGLIIQAPSGIIKFQAGASASGVSDRMVITNAGNVGIGTTTPDARLVVESNGDGFGETDDRFLIKVKNKSTSSASQAIIQVSAGSGNNFMNISQSASNYSISEKADASIVYASGTGGLVLQASPKSGSEVDASSIRFYTGWVNVPGGSIERMTLDKRGYLGIGTTTPKAKLEVTNGDVYVNDSTKGIILKAPNGSCWRVTVDNTGNFVRTSITCPN